MRLLICALSVLLLCARGIYPPPRPIDRSVAHVMTVARYRTARRVFGSLTTAPRIGARAVARLQQPYPNLREDR